MHDQAFAEAARPRARRILRLPLLEYSIGHEILLQREQNALLAPGEAFLQLPGKEKSRALLRAVLICSQTWKENQRPWRWFSVWSWFVRGHQDFASSIAEFQIYRREGAAPAFGESVFDQGLGFLMFLYYARMEEQESVKIENRMDGLVKTQLAEHIEAYRKEQEGACRH
jgi:hypothetical protein